MSKASAVPFTVFEDNIAWAWGRLLNVYSISSQALTTIPENELILAIALDHDTIVVVKDDRTVSLRSLTDVSNIRDTFILPKRAMKIELCGDGLLIADKFGDVCHYNMDELRRLSVLEENKLLRDRNPNRLVIAERLQKEGLLRVTDAGMSKEDVSGVNVDAEMSKEDVSDVNVAEEITNTKKRPATDKSSIEGSVVEDDDAEDVDDALDVVSKMPFLGHLATVTQMKLYPNWHLLVSCDRDEKIRVTRYPELWIAEAILTGHSEYLTDAQLLSPIHLVSASYDGTVRLWNVPEAREEDKVKCDVTPLSVVPSGLEELSVFFADSRLHQSYKINNGRLMKLTETQLPEPVCAVTSGINRVCWLSTDGALWIKQQDGSYSRKTERQLGDPLYVDWKKFVYDVEKV